MPSTFPGMNPYLEQDDAWHDFHKSFIPHLGAVIGGCLPAHHFVKIAGHAYVHEVPAAERTFLSVDVERLSYLEIRDRRDRRLVTVIELLSPTNKYSSPHREQYLGKRGHLLGSSVHFVEIDLLRGGPRMPLPGTLPDCAYYVMVSRMEKRPQADLWPIQLRDPLPVIPIPLREPDPDVRIDLQAVLHHIYDAAGYSSYIYEGAPQPSLSAADAAWARQFVPAPS